MNTACSAVCSRVRIGDDRPALAFLYRLPLSFSSSSAISFFSPHFLLSFGELLSYLFLSCGLERTQTEPSSRSCLCSLRSESCGVPSCAASPLSLHLYLHASLTFTQTFAALRCVRPLRHLSLSHPLFQSCYSSELRCRLCFSPSRPPPFVLYSLCNTFFPLFLFSHRPI